MPQLIIKFFMKSSRLSIFLLTVGIIFILSMCSDLLTVQHEYKTNKSISLSEAEKNVIDLLDIIDAKKTKAGGNRIFYIFPIFIKD